MNISNIWYWLAIFWYNLVYTLKPLAVPLTILAIIHYCIYSFFVFKRTEGYMEKRWMAWIPVVNVFFMQKFASDESNSNLFHLFCIFFGFGAAFLGGFLISFIYFPDTVMFLIFLVLYGICLLLVFITFFAGLYVVFKKVYTKPGLITFLCTVIPGINLLCSIVFMILGAIKKEINTDDETDDEEEYENGDDEDKEITENKEDENEVTGDIKEKEEKTKKKTVKKKENRKPKKKKQSFIERFLFSEENIDDYDDEEDDDYEEKIPEKPKKKVKKEETKKVPEKAKKTNIKKKAVKKDEEKKENTASLEKIATRVDKELVLPKLEKEQDKEPEIKVPEITPAEDVSNVLKDEPVDKRYGGDDDDDLLFFD